MFSTTRERKRASCSLDSSAHCRSAKGGGVCIEAAYMLMEKMINHVSQRNDIYTQRYINIAVSIYNVAGCV